jgi:hypothetical protein
MLVSKTMLSATIAAVLAASAPAAFAQATSSVPSSTTGVDRPMQATHVMPGQIRFTDMNGATVYDRQNAKLGDINNVVLDRDGQVAAVVIKTGAVLGVGGRTVAIAMDQLKVSNGSDGKPRFTAGMTKEQLKSAQAYDVTLPRSNGAGSSNPPSDRK